MLSFCHVAAHKDAFSSNSASNLNDLVYSKGHVYIPDFTVRALTDIEFIKVRRHQYIAAQRATLMERQPKTPREESDATSEDPFSSEWKKAQTHLSEGTPVSPYMRQHQRNFSSGNLEELLHRRDLKMSPLVSNATGVHIENGPKRTVIYPDNTSSALQFPVDHERVHLLPESKLSANIERTEDSWPHVIWPVTCSLPFTKPKNVSMPICNHKPDIVLLYCQILHRADGIPKLHCLCRCSYTANQLKLLFLLHRADWWVHKVGSNAVNTSIHSCEPCTSQCGCESKVLCMNHDR